MNNESYEDIVERLRRIRAESQPRSPVAGPTPPEPAGGQRFGAPRPGGRTHQGVDYPYPAGSPVRSPNAGVVEETGFQPSGAGHFVKVRSEDGLLHEYYHLEAPPGFRSGDRVGVGQEIGRVGSTGRSTGPHLHYGVRDPNGAVLDPTSRRQPAGMESAQVDDPRLKRLAELMKEEERRPLESPAADGVLKKPDPESGSVRLPPIAEGYREPSRYQAGRPDTGVRPEPVAAQPTAEDQDSVLQRVFGMGVDVLKEQFGGYALGIADVAEFQAKAAPVLADVTEATPMAAAGELILRGVGLGEQAKQAKLRRQEQVQVAAETIAGPAREFKKDFEKRLHPSITQGSLRDKVGSWRWWIHNMTRQAPQLGYQAALAYGTRGRSLPVQFSAWAGPVFTMETGAQYDALRARGEIHEVASTTALLTGAGATLIERVPGAAFLLGKIPGAEKILGRGLASRLDKMVATNRFARGLETLAAEGFAETLQEVWGDVMDYAQTKDPEAFEQWVDRYITSGLIGGAVGGVAGATTRSLRREDYDFIQRVKEDPDYVQRVIDDFIAGGQEPEVGPEPTEETPPSEPVITEEPPPSGPTTVQPPPQGPPPTGPTFEEEPPTEVVPPTVEPPTEVAPPTVEPPPQPVQPPQPVDEFPPVTDEIQGAERIEAIGTRIDALDQAIQTAQTEGDLQRVFELTEEIDRWTEELDRLFRDVQFEAPPRTEPEPAQEPVAPEPPAGPTPTEVAPPGPGEAPTEIVPQEPSEGPTEEGPPTTVEQEPAEAEPSAPPKPMSKEDFEKLLQDVETEEVGDVGASRGEMGTPEEGTTEQPSVNAQQLLRDARRNYLKYRAANFEKPLNAVTRGLARSVVAAAQRAGEPIPPEILNDYPEFAGGGQRGEAPAGPTGPGEPGSGVAPGPGGEPAGGGGPAPGAGEGPGRGGEGAGVQPGPGGPVQPGAERRPPLVAPGGVRAVAGREGEAPVVLRGARLRVEPSPSDTPERAAEIEAANDSPAFVPVGPRLGPQRRAHPRLVVEPRALAGIEKPAITERVTSPVLETLWESGALSDVQVEAVLATVQQWAKDKGILIADAVGLGKTREALGIILEAAVRGQDRILYTTRGPLNIVDVVKEFKELLGNDIRQWPFELVVLTEPQHRHLKTPQADPNKIPTPESVGKPILYVLHSYVYNDFHASLMRMGLKAWVADEAHFFKNLTGDAPSTAAIRWRELHAEMIPRGGKFAYLTATPAVGFRQLHYLLGLRAWPLNGFDETVRALQGRRPPLTDEEFRRLDDPNQISQAPAPARRRRGQAGAQRFFVSPGHTEQMMRELSAQGFYLARELWRGGVELQIEQIDLTREETGVGPVPGTLEGPPVLQIDPVAATEGVPGPFELEDMQKHAAELGLSNWYDLAVQAMDQMEIGTTIRFGREPDAATTTKQRDGRWSSTEDPRRTVAAREVLREERRETGGVFRANVARDIWRRSLGGLTRAQRVQLAAQLTHDIDWAFRSVAWLAKHSVKTQRRRASSTRGSLQGYMKQLLFDIRLDHIIQEARRHIARGDQVVIALASVTGDQMIQDALDPSESTTLNNRLLNAIDTIPAYETHRVGDKIVRGNEIEGMLEIKAMLKARAEALPALRNPVQAIQEAFGVDQVGFVTGSVTIKQREDMKDGFQEGRLKVMVISDAGKTGISLHDVNGHRRVLMMADYDWSADVMKQALGRVDRAGQLSLPLLRLYVSKSMAEQRFSNTIAQRMVQIGATSAGSAEATGATSLEDFDIEDAVLRDAMAQAYFRLPMRLKQAFTGSAFIEHIPHSRQLIPRSLPVNGFAVNDFLNDLLFMPLETQNKIWAEVFKQYELLADEDVKTDKEAQRTARSTGEILRYWRLNDTLTLFEVRNEKGEQRGIVSGVISPEMWNIQEARGDQPGTGRHRPLRWVVFQPTQGGDPISGLLLQPTELRDVRRDYGLTVRHQVTPLTVWQDLEAGDKVVIMGPEGTNWSLHKRKDGRIEIRGARASERDHWKAFAAHVKKGDYVFLVNRSNPRQPTRYADLKDFLIKYPPVTTHAADWFTDDVIEVDPGIQHVMEDLPEDGTPAPVGFEERPVNDLYGMNQHGGPAQEVALTKIGPRLQGEMEDIAHERGVVSRVDIVRALSRATHAAGEEIPIRVGFLSLKWAAGTYNFINRLIRLKSANDINTAAHEVGHAIEYLIYGRVLGSPWKSPNITPEIEAELIDAGKRLYGAHTPNGGYKREGWAEFIAMYVTGPSPEHGNQPLDQIMPKTLEWFTGHFKRSFPKVVKQVDRAKALSDTYRDQGAMKRAESHVWDPTKPAEKVKSWRQRYKQFGLKAQLFEINQGLYDIAKRAKEFRESKGDTLRPRDDPYMLSFLSQTHHARTDYMIRKAMIDVAGNPRDDVQPLNAITPMVKGHYDEFVIYLLAARTVALAEDPKGKPREGAMSYQDARWLVGQLEQQFPKFKQAASIVYAFQEAVLDYMAQASPTLARMVAQIRARDPGMYVPLQREFLAVEEQYHRMGGSIAGKPNAIKRLRGSGRRVKPPLDQIVSNTAIYIRAAHTRMIVDALARLVHSAQMGEMEGLGKYITKVPRNQVPVLRAQLLELLEKINRHLVEQGGEPLEIPPEDLPFLEDYVTIFRPAVRPPSGYGIVPVYINGTWEWFQVSTNLTKILEHTDVFRFGYNIAGLPVLEWVLGKPAALFRLGTTGLRASFGLLWNPTRDLQTFYLNTRSRANPFILFREWFYGVVGSGLRFASGERVNWTYVDLFYRLGINMAQPLAQDIGHTARTARRIGGRRIFTIGRPGAWLDLFRDLFQVPEAAPRVAEIKLVAKQIGLMPGQPMSVDQALLLIAAGKQVTVDFTAAGEFTRVWNRIAPFHNVAFQGPRASLRAMRRDPYVFWAKGFSMIALALWQWWEHKDEEWYRDMPIREKFMHWHVPFEWKGRPELVRLPISFETGMIFKALPEMLLDAWYHQDPEAVRAFMGLMFDSFTPNTYPVILSAAVENLQNRDSFFDRPIVPQGELHGRRPHQQYDEYTTRASVFIAKLFEGKPLPEGLKWLKSPRRIDHILDSVAGGAARDYVRLAEGVVGVGTGPRQVDEPASLPVIGRAIQRGGPAGVRSRWIEEAYNILEELDQNSFEETSEEREMRLLFQDGTRALTNLYASRRLVTTAEEQRALSAEANRLAKDLLRRFEEGDISRDEMRAHRKTTETRRKQAEGEPVPGRPTGRKPRATRKARQPRQPAGAS